MAPPPPPHPLVFRLISPFYMVQQFAYVMYECTFTIIAIHMIFFPMIIEIFRIFWFLQFFTA